MTATDFHLTTQRHLAAPAQVVWGALSVHNGRCGGLRWRQWNYSKRATFTASAPSTHGLAHRADRRADRERAGTGRWTISSDGAGTSVRYDWPAAVATPVDAAARSVGAAAAAWNQDTVMAWGHAASRASAH